MLIIEEQSLNAQRLTGAPITRFAGKYEFLSNFYPAPVLLDGQAYPTVEHAFQAAKTFDLDERQAILLSGAPAAAKRLGRRLTLRADWEKVKTEILRTLLWQKFSLPELRELLLETGDAELIEGNTWNDRFWGCTQTARGEWIGQNRQGKLLMEIRGAIRYQRSGIR